MVTQRKDSCGDICIFRTKDEDFGVTFYSGESCWPICFNGIKGFCPRVGHINSFSLSCSFMILTI